MRPLSFAVLIVLISTALNAQQRQSCKHRSDLVGQCSKIHGRAYIVNGPGLIIWRIGTTRILAVEGEEENVPKNLSDAIHSGGDPDFGMYVFGDFEVCPLTRDKPGEMQWVCMESASHLVARERKD